MITKKKIQANRSKWMEAVQVQWCGLTVGGVRLTGVDKHWLSWNWVIRIQNGARLLCFSPPPPTPLLRGERDWNRPGSHSATAWILERAINVIVSHNLAHEGEYNYSAAFPLHLHANDGATLNLLFFHDSGGRGRGGGGGGERKAGRYLTLPRLLVLGWGQRRRCGAFA